MKAFLAAVVFLCAKPAWAAHAYSQFGDIKYPPGFTHFEWVNPDAPKGGEIELVPPLRITNFDKFNPFTIRGSAPPGLGALVFESLLTGTSDEPTTAYGLLAEDVALAPDGLSVTFRLNAKARFQDGTPVTAADVKHSFDTLMSKQASPAYRFALAEVERAVLIGPLSVRFDFRRASALYEDDGISHAFVRGAYFLTTIELERTGGELRLYATVTGAGFPEFRRRRFRVVFANVVPRDVSVNGASVTLEGSVVVFENSGQPFELFARL